MVTSAGKSAETVRMKAKPITAGFKMWAIAERGYVCDLFLTLIGTHRGLQNRTRAKSCLTRVWWPLSVISP